MPVTWARAAALALTLAILFGTLMPGSWKTSALQPIPSPVDLAAAAHVLLFAALAFTLSFARVWGPRGWPAPTLALALALLTEGLQFFAIDRHPNLAGLVQDGVGTLSGWAAALSWQARLQARPR